jgi:hypothetical protein
MPDPAESEGLVLDTSVLINLLATEAMEAIFGALAVPSQGKWELIEQGLQRIARHARA